MTTTTGHREDCLCVPCMMSDMDDAIQAMGMDPSGYGTVNVAPERTRYARAGQGSGYGVVRRVSPKQVAFIKRLMAQRDTTNLVRLPGSEDIENMSLRGARDLIDRLLACPTRPDATEPTATDAQLGFIRSLATRKQYELSQGQLTKAQASELITKLKALPDPPKAQTAELQSGIYLVDGTVYKVQKAIHGSGRMYAKRLEVTDGVAEFVYASGMVHRIRPEQKMTLEQAKQFGAVYGVCCSCGATLTDEKSIEAGIGPICAKKF